MARNLILTAASCCIFWILLEATVYIFTDPITYVQSFRYENLPDPESGEITLSTPQSSLASRISKAFSSHDYGNFRILPKAKCDPELLIPHEYIGKVLRPNSSIHCRKEGDGDVVMSAVYSTDDHHRRTAPGATVVGERPTALFMGCSFTFGSAVQDHETLPARFGAHQQSWNVYNYGSIGWGPSNVLALSEKPEFFSDIHRQQQKVIGIYLFIDNHINRMIGSLDIYRNRRDWVQYLPRYEFDQVGRLVHRGMIGDSLYGTHPFFHLLSYSRIIPLIGANLPLAIEQEDMRQLIQTFVQIRENLRSLFGGFEMIIAFYPGSTASQQLAPALQKRDFSVLDYSKIQLREHLDGPDIVPDGHPSALAYEFLGHRLAQDVNNLNLAY